jgi:subtilisin family serine protease
MVKGRKAARAAKRPATAAKRTASKRGGIRRATSSTYAATFGIPSPQAIRISQVVARVTAPLVVKAGANPKAQTVIYVHGIGNKPVASVLKSQWDNALFGTNLGDRSRMAYWVNREYYPKPEPLTGSDPDQVSVDDEAITTPTVLALAKAQSPEEADPVEQEIRALSQSTLQAEFLRSIAAKMTADSDAAAEARFAAVAAADVTAKLLLLPRPIRDRIVQGLTRALLRDVNDFFFNETRRKAMTDSLVERLAVGGGPFVIIAHSQGSMIAYEVLRHLSQAEFDVRLLVTIGSPLGLQEVQDVFRTWIGVSAGGRLPRPPCVAKWWNVADRLDPVAFDSDLTDEFDGVLNKRKFFLNPDSPRHPHSATGYLRTKWVQDPVREPLSNAFAQAVGQMVITRDLVDDLEDHEAGFRHKTLIELRTVDSAEGAPIGDLADTATRVTDAIESMAKKRPDKGRDLTIDRMRRFVAADLTRSEVEQLRTLFAELNIQRVWRDMHKRALINASTHTVQARPANLGYGATGKEIGWAVLDTGIRGDHPHFSKHRNIVAQWNCTRNGAPTEHPAGTKESDALDGNGHGTHVAATIAGTLGVPERAPRDGEDAKDVPRVEFSGMAPQTKLYGFKVLTNQGTGHDSYIIKALDKIAEINESSSQLVIHGVNLSLGGGFDPSVYGCGHTPLCQELRRLWRQGVLVCLAAGNEGYAMLRSDTGLVAANLDLSIGDPANLDEAIAVGSVHKTNPHTYGISYFSSRGPTADGRRKPDLVAPGERIVSAFHDWPRNKPAEERTSQDLYVEMSGTSMATPHVSGILAAFLSIRREFIGFPDRVKAMLMKGCTDLGRDPYIQGAGMPNLIRMLSDS